MNQILNIINPKFNKVIKRNKRRYLWQFSISIILILIIILTYSIVLISNRSKDITAKKIANNYNILKLYNNNSNSKTQQYNQGNLTFSVIGIIEIPKLNIYYPIISEANDELLKIAPCRIAGPMPNENGNLCIAGHNYDNYKFFSKISNLEINDDINIYDINKNFLVYKVYDIYEVVYDNLTPLEQTNKSNKEITLITCNNFNSDNRIVVKAISK